MNDIINFFETSQYEYLKEKDKSYLKNTSQFFTLKKLGSNIFNTDFSEKTCSNLIEEHLKITNKKM